MLLFLVELGHLILLFLKDMPLGPSAIDVLKIYFE